MTEDKAIVPSYHVVQDDSDVKSLEGRVRLTMKTRRLRSSVGPETIHPTYKSRLAESQESHHAYLRSLRSPIGWAMRTLDTQQTTEGEI